MFDKKAVDSNALDVPQQNDIGKCFTIKKKLFFFHSHADASTKWFSVLKLNGKGRATGENASKMVLEIF